MNYSLANYVSRKIPTPAAWITLKNVLEVTQLPSHIDNKPALLKYSYTP